MLVLKLQRSNNMKKIFYIMSAIFALTSCSQKTASKLPDDTKYLLSSYADENGNIVENLVGVYPQTKDFYIYKGKIVKEDNKYYFVDDNFTFHCSIHEDTRIYKNDNFSEYDGMYYGIEEEKECYIWVSAFVSYSGNHGHHSGDRKMVFDYSSRNFEECGFYDHVLDIYYNCDMDKINQHALDVTYEFYPGLKE